MKTKSILLSIQPQWVEKILNGEKTIEVRTRFPKDYKGWVYIYCTKRKPFIRSVSKFVFMPHPRHDGKSIMRFNLDFPIINGKVVARFWCDDVGIIKLHNCLSIPTMAYTTFVSNKYYSDTDLQTASCLNGNELMRYLGTKKEEVGYAIHISKLEIFDRPRELSEFMTQKSYSRYQKELEEAYKLDAEIAERMSNGDAFDDECANAVELTKMSKGYFGLTKAPQNYCYIEEGEE